ncbi:MAG: hypothetical protein HC802_22100, partial [Caldilineaceae bacterium]|nr:hypothetical protein [Caldilineaceae bacterium]
SWPNPKLNMSQTTPRCSSIRPTCPRTSWQLDQADRKEMKDAAKALEFERAAALRDQLMELRRLEVEDRLGV